MDEKSFQEVIQFAIRREIDSVDFYTKAGQASKLSGAKELFSDFAKEEQGHRKLLENIHMERVVQARIEPIPNLRISDYMVDAVFMPDLPYAGILRIAMKREERSIQLYQDLEEPTKDENLKKLFSFLVQEETKHKYKLEKIYDDEILK